MSEIFDRTVKLIGKQSFDKIQKSNVIIFGVGGVGGTAAEALVRGGVGSLTLVDNDTVALSNLNRQIVATQLTIGQKKTCVAKERFLSIRPDMPINCIDMFVLPESIGAIDFSRYDYIVDAIDTISGKLALMQAAKQAGIPFVGVMGAGNKLNSTLFEVIDISNTTVCPLARVIRKESKKKYGIEHAKVVYSKEIALKPQGDERIPGSVSFVPGVAGLIAAGEVIKDIMFGTGVIPS